MFFCLGLIFSVLSQTVLAGPVIQVEQQLNNVDSLTLSHKMAMVFPQESFQSGADGATINQRTLFTSRDESVSMDCSRKLTPFGYMDAVCKIELDSTKTENSELTQLGQGAFEGVYFAKLMSPEDTQRLAEALAPTGRFSSSEKVRLIVKGELREIPILQLSCMQDEEENSTCTLLLAQNP